MGGHARDRRPEEEGGDAERAPAPSPSPAPSVQGVLALQKGAGNAAVARFISESMGSALSGAVENAGKLAESAGAAIAAATPKAQAAQRMYEALNWTNDNGALLKEMFGRSRTEMQEIDQAFQALYGQPLKEYLQSQLSMDYLVKAMAMYHGTTPDGQHTVIALSLIAGINPQDALNVLQQSDFDGRQKIEERYKRCFGDLNEGSLRADLEDALWGIDETRALVLLDNEMTPALEIYLDSVAMTGTNTAKVVARFTQAYQAKGPAGIAELGEDWMRNVSGWYTTLSLYEAMEAELSGEPWQKVKAYLDGGTVFDTSRELRGLFEEVTGTDLTADEMARLKTEKDLLTTATEGGYTGYGMDREAAFAAVERIRAIYDERKARLLGRADLTEEKRRELTAKLDAQWKAERESLTAQLRAESSSVRDVKEARVTLASGKTDADKLFIAFDRDDAERALKVVREVWMAGGIHKLRADARTAVKEGARTVRPSYSPDQWLAMFKTGDEWTPVRILVEETYPRVTGGALIDHYLREASSDSDLKPLIDFLTGVPAGLRDSSVEWALTLRGIRPTSTPGRTLAEWVAQNIEHGSNAVKLADLIDPASAVADPAARARLEAERAQARLNAQERGALAELLGVGYGREDDHARLYESSEQSIERLKRLAALHQARAARDALIDAGKALGYDLTDDIPAPAGDRYLKQMAQMYGGETPSADAINSLSDKEYEAFGSRVEQLASARQQQAQVAAFMATLAADAVITAITGGVYAPALLAALGGAVAGMVTQEVALGSEYKLLSGDNAQAIAVAVATAGVKTGYGELLKADLGKLDDLPLVQGMMAEASKDLVGGISESTFSTILSGKLPTDAEVAYAATQRVFGMASAAGGKKFEALRKPNDGVVFTLSQQLRREVIDRGAPAAWNAIGTSTIAAAKGGFDGSGMAWTSGVVAEALKSFTSSVQDTIKGKMAAGVQEHRSERAHDRFYEDLKNDLGASGGA